MQDPQLVDVASLNPGKCFTCGSIQGPMVDTMVDTFDGRFYVCVHTCLTGWGRLAGLGEVAEIEERLEDSMTGARALAAQLEEQQPIVEAVLLVAEELASRPPADVEPPAAEDTPPPVVPEPVV